MGATWLYEHKQIPKKSSLILLVRFLNNLIEMFLESELQIYGAPAPMTQDFDKMAHDFLR